MTKALDGHIVLIRGGGELATGVAWSLAKAGYRVVVTEVAEPLMVRWPVCFGTAVAEGYWAVEGIGARLVSTADECAVVWSKGEIAVIVDPFVQCLSEVAPLVLIDAIMAKRNLGTRKEMAPLTIGLGPGFTAKTDVDIVVETNRGHNLGRLIFDGQAEPNTGIPGEIGGIARERVLYSAQAGVFRSVSSIGQYVRVGEILGEIEGEQRTEPVAATLDGMLRGLLRTQTPVDAQVKIGDIDPRGQQEYCWTISEKARLIGAAVLLGSIVWLRDNNI